MKIVLLGALLTALASGCTTTQESKLAATPAVPAATGMVKVKDSKDGNSQLKVKVEHLAPPREVSQGTHAYVVWVQPVAGEARPQNVGQLQIDKDLSGTLETKVPFNEFNVFVTAEPSGSVTRPSGNRVLVSEEVQRAAH